MFLRKACALTVAAVLLLLAAASVQAQQPKPVPLTTFDDAADGTTLQYPSVWKRVDGAHASCPAMVFGQDAHGRVHVPVTFGVEFTGKGNYYRKTTLDGLVFLFGTVKGLTDKQCDGITKEFQKKPPPPSLQPVGEMQWEYGRGGGCGAAHAIDAQVYARTIGDRCYVIETDFDWTPGTPKDRRTLTLDERKALNRHLNDITASVRIRSVMLPKSWATTTFRDPATGVSFEYPAAMKPTKDVGAYVPPAMTLMKGLRWRARLVYEPTYSFPPGPIEEASTDLSELLFLYATKPMPSGDGCRALVRHQGESFGDHVPPVLTIHGVRFAAGPTGEAGAGNATWGRIYATYRNGLCFIFEEDSVADSSGGDVTQAQWNEIDAHMQAIATTIRFEQKNETR